MAEYQQSRGKLPLLPGMPEEFANMDDLYVQLTLEHRDQNTSKISKRTLKSHSELLALKDKNGLIKRVLIRGGPGGGKSTLVSKVALDWACEKSDKGFKSCNLLFALDFRAIEKEMSVMDAIHDQLLPEFPKSCIDTNETSTIFLLDGFDEGANMLQHPEWLDLLQGKWLQKSLVIVTTRPHKVTHFNYLTSNSGRGVYPLVQIEGFSRSQVEKYVGRFYKSISDDVDEFKEKVQSLIKRINQSPTLNDLSRIPIMLNMICLLWTTKEDMPQTTTSLYQEALRFLVMHRDAKYKGQYDDAIDDDEVAQEEWVNKMIINVGDAALRGLFEDRLIFKPSEFSPTLDLDEPCHLGILSKDRTRGLRTIQHVSFLHKTFQEICAGMYWANLAESNLERFLEFVNKIRAGNYRGIEVMLRFACVTSAKAAEEILPHVSALSYTWMIDCLKTQALEKDIGSRYGRSALVPICGIGNKTSDPWYLPLILLHESQFGDLCNRLHRLFDIESMEIKVGDDEELMYSLNFFLRSYLSNRTSITSTECIQTRHLKLALYSCSNLSIKVFTKLLQFIRKIESLTISIRSDFSWDSVVRSVGTDKLDEICHSSIGGLHALENLKLTGSTSNAHLSGISELFCRCGRVTNDIKRVEMWLFKESGHHACNFLRQCTSLKSVDLLCASDDFSKDDLVQVFGAISPTIDSISFNGIMGGSKLPVCMLQPSIAKLRKIHLGDCLDLPELMELCQLILKDDYAWTFGEAEKRRTLPCQKLTLTRIPINQETAEILSSTFHLMKDLRFLELWFLMNSDERPMASIGPVDVFGRPKSLGRNMNSEVQRIAGSLHHLTSLELLNLSNNELGGATGALCKSLQSLSELCELNLATASLNESHISLIAKTLRYLPALCTLNLMNNEIGRAMHDICHGLKYCTIKHLMLDDTHLSNDGVRALPYTHLQQLEILNIDGIHSRTMFYNQEGVEYLFQNLRFTINLKCIHIMYQHTWHDVNFFLKECYRDCSLIANDGGSMELRPHSIQLINEFVEKHCHMVQTKQARYAKQLSHI